MARPLPHNKEAEAAVLAGILLRNEALNDVITLIDEEAFYVPAYKSVFKAMTKLSDRGQPIEFGLHQVIPGWTEGLQLMVVGEKTRLFIPSELAYGNRAAGAIQPGSTLIFDVELLEIN